MKEQIIAEGLTNYSALKKFEKQINDDWLAHGWTVKTMSMARGDNVTEVIFVLQKGESMTHD